MNLISFLACFNNLFSRKQMGKIWKDNAIRDLGWFADRNYNYNLNLKMLHVSLLNIYNLQLKYFRFDYKILFWLGALLWCKLDIKTMGRMKTKSQTGGEGSKWRQGLWQSPVSTTARNIQPVSGACSVDNIYNCKHVQLTTILTFFLLFFEIKSKLQ